MPWKVGILCPSDTELEPFLPHIRDGRTTREAMLTFHTGRIGGLPVTAVYSGVCKVNAAIAAQLLIDRFGCNAIVNAGVAGGIDPSVGLFDTVVSERAAYHDVAGDILTEFHPWMPSPWFSCEGPLLSAARSVPAPQGHALRFGDMVTGESFIQEGNREEILRKFSPLSVDMETAAVAHVCHVNRIPFLAVRTITDTARQDAADRFEQNCPLAAAITAEVVLSICNNLAKM